MNTATLEQRGLLTIAIDTLDNSGPFQQRRTRASAQADAGLAESIKALGVLQPILVRWNEDAQAHQVVDGHRRVAAARAAGLDTIRAVEVATEERMTMAAGIAANHQRAALAPVDLWRAMVHLQDEHGWTLDGAAMALGIPTRLAKQLDKLGRLHPDMIAAIEAGEMPEEDELAIIAGAPHEVQVKALGLPNAWLQTQKGVKAPEWYVIANACQIKRIPQSRAIFDIKAIVIAWDEDLFAQPDDADRFTTTDVEGFLTAQIAALTARTTRGKLRSVEWDRKAQGPRLPSGWTRVFDKKTVGAVRFAAVQPEGYSVGCIVEVYAVPPPEPAKKKGEEQAAPAPKPAAASPEAETLGGALGSSLPPAPLPAGVMLQDDGEDDGDDLAHAQAAPPAKKREPLTEKGRIMLAEAKTTAIRCALRDRRDHITGSILATLVLALAGNNVTVRGDPKGPHVSTSFTDLAARLVDADGQPIGFSLMEAIEIAAEAAARMIVCTPTQHYGNSSGSPAEWIGRLLEAHRDMPRLDTAELLATVNGEALKAADIAAGGTGKGTSKAIRERLAGNTPDLALPGSAFEAKGPLRADRRPEGHVGPFPCTGCSDPGYCIAEVFCESAKIDADDAEGEE